MRYILVFNFFIFIAACSNHPLSTNQLDKTVQQPDAKTDSAALTNKVVLVPEDILPLKSSIDESDTDTSPINEHSSASVDTTNSQKDSISDKKQLITTSAALVSKKPSNTEDVPYYKPKESNLAPSPTSQKIEYIDKKADKINALVDKLLRLNTQNALNPELVDYSEYGFITPSNELQSKVNSELRELRNTDSSKTSTNLLDRVRNNFKLDLTLENKRTTSQLNWYIRNPNYLDRTFKRSARYMHFIVEEILKRDLPMELALLPFVESAYDPFAYSHGRASGLWQFIPGTGKAYGLHQNWWYDGRRDIPASTKAALDYLSYLNKRFDGDWLHALAAYNSGSGRVGKAIRKNKKLGKKTDFWSLHLPKETKAYVPKLLALSKLVLNPEKYGSALPPIPDQPYFKIVQTGSQIDLAQAASLADIDINEIYKLNPGFNQWASSPLGPHRLLIPIERAEKFAIKLKALSPTKRLNWNRYSVRNGDSLSVIAKKFNTTPTLIMQVNHLKSNMIRVKQKLLIPIASKGKSYYDLSQQNRLSNKQNNLKGSKGSTKLYYTVKSGDTIWDLALAHKVGVRSLAKWNGMAPKDVLRPGKKLLIWSKANQNSANSPATHLPGPFAKKRDMIKRIGYRVRKGDSLAKIANKFSVSISNLIVWNKLNKKKYLQPGQKLTIYVDLTNS
ncbi:MAG: membrane-bound lytic murein transglycosylase D [Oleiphilaceae bacterium]|jgi:membrane-bound lytic murein transglycosylase D